jgi:hypothetical protein
VDIDARAILMCADGDIAKNGSFLRWNLVPAYVVYRVPHLLLFDDKGRAEVRHVMTGRMCEVVNEEGLKPLRACRSDQGLLGVGRRGLVELVEVSL